MSGMFGLKIFRTNHGYKKIDDERKRNQADDNIHGYNFSQAFIYNQPKEKNAIVTLMKMMSCIEVAVRSRGCAKTVPNGSAKLAILLPLFYYQPRVTIVARGGSVKNNLECLVIARKVTLLICPLYSHALAVVNCWDPYAKSASRTSSSD
jgi:hypothetical protein